MAGAVPEGSFETVTGDRSWEFGVGSSEFHDRMTSDPQTLRLVNMVKGERRKEKVNYGLRFINFSFSGKRLLP